MIARMQIRETAWSQLLFDWQTCAQDPDNCTLSSSIQAILSAKQWHIVEDAQNPAGFILIDVIGSESDIDELYNHFAVGDRIGYGDSDGPWKWNFNGKVDFVTEYTGQYNDILASQPSGSSFEDPQWSHGWLGQDENRFSRAVSREFGEDFE